MRLFIAEKPELAKAIVEGLGGGSRKDGYFDCGSDCVTWCFGHMLELCDPEDYDEKYAKWNINDLPISHVPWKKKVSKDKKKQVKIIVDLIKNANIIVNAGDPDEEGQLLVDEIIEYSKSSVPVKRVLINDNNTKVVQKSLANLRDNAEFHGFSQAAEARSVGDQLYGYNLSRAYTLKAQEKGMQGVLSVGRVQTPVLGMVVRRERENKAHKKAYYYNVNGVFDVSGCQFPARYQVSDSDTQDDNGRLIDEEQARKIATAVSGQSAKVVKAETKNKKELAPLPYNLLKLQTDASRKFGYKPDQVKQITQDLREKHKLITYNRSDCEYLSDEQHADAQGILSAIATTAPLLAKASTNADPNVKGRAFNSSKVSAHHAIIPTEATANFAKLSEPEQKIYMLIARQYIAQFWPDRIYEQTILELDVGGHIFSAIANVTIQQGFKVLYKNDQGNEDLKSNEDDLNADLRSIKNGDIGRCIDAKSEQKETKPPALYTIATLLSDLTRVAKYIKDERLKKLLIEKDKDKAGEHGGIGTPATRDTIIKGLFDRGKNRKKGKSIVATELGH
ncbi:MAG: DNA topoisomerase 3, partial [Xanthomonadales bacterium]|nr:DNA topoisomerase 3 [Xanthomonadales bacterium]